MERRARVAVTVALLVGTLWSGPIVAAGPARTRLAANASISTPEGRRAVRSLLRTAGPMAYGDYLWNDVVAADPVWVRVDLARQLVSVFRGPDEIGTAVILYGADRKSTPRGAFRVLERDRDHHSSLYDAPMPFMLRLTADGVAIHASDVRSGRATHGCVGVPPEFARRLFDAARRGTTVYVV